MKPFSFLSFLLLLCLLAPTAVEAKLLPQAKKTTGTAVNQAVPKSINVSPRLRADRKALVITFSNLQVASSVSFNLIYQTNGNQEGAGGSITLDGQHAVTRELLFGTCSAGVCKYHQNITNMKFEVTTTLKNGKKTLKRFRIRV